VTDSGQGLGGHDVLTLAGSSQTLQSCHLSPAFKRPFSKL
jgi:hypothetical protein